MGSLETFLAELSATVDDALHKRLIEAYSTDAAYDVLLEACNAYVEERIGEIEGAYSRGVQRVQREPQN